MPEHFLFNVFRLFGWQNNTISGFSYFSNTIHHLILCMRYFSLTEEDNVYSNLVWHKGVGDVKTFTLMVWLYENMCPLYIHYSWDGREIETYSGLCRIVSLKSDLIKYYHESFVSFLFVYLLYSNKLKGECIFDIIYQFSSSSIQHYSIFCQICEENQETYDRVLNDYLLYVGEVLT